MTSKYTVNGTDLSSIFYALSSTGSTPQTTPTGFLYNAGTDASPNYKDLIYLFSAYVDEPKAVVTNYISSAYNKDLNAIFQRIDYTPTTYTVTDQTALMKYTETSYNGYTGLVFIVNSTDARVSASATITFNKTINATIIVVGGGGGGGGYTGGGGGGGGTTFVSQSISKDSSYNIFVGSGGAKGPVYYGNGTDGLQSNFGNYISYPGKGGNASSQCNGGAGGNINTNYGGGGGGGGGGAYVSRTNRNSRSSGGTAGTNQSGGNSAGASQGVQGVTPSGLNVYFYGGKGGNSYNQDSSGGVFLPFITSTPTIKVGGGGGGGGSAQNAPNPTLQGGYCGVGDGGLYGYSDDNRNGQTSFSSISSGYGNGGGGGGGDGGTAILPNYTGGNGGAGVVIIYWQT